SRPGGPAVPPSDPFDPFGETASVARSGWYCGLSRSGRPPPTLREPGRSSAWLERLLWEQEAAGSNPAVPTQALTLGSILGVGHDAAAAPVGGGWSHEEGAPRRNRDRSTARARPRRVGRPERATRSRLRLKGRTDRDRDPHPGAGRVRSRAPDARRPHARTARPPAHRPRGLGRGGPCVRREQRGAARPVGDEARRG